MGELEDVLREIERLEREQETVKARLAEARARRDYLRRPLEMRAKYERALDQHAQALEAGRTYQERAALVQRIRKYAKALGTKPPDLRVHVGWTDAIKGEVLRARLAGRTYKDIARQYDVSPERMRQVVSKAEREAIYRGRRRFGWGEHPWNGGPRLTEEEIALVFGPHEEAPPRPTGTRVDAARLVGDVDTSKLER